MNILIDMATVTFIVLTVVVSYHKGFLRSVLELAGYIVSLVVAGLLSVSAGNWIFENLLRSVLEKAVSGYIATLSGGALRSFNATLSQMGIPAQVAADSVQQGQNGVSAAVMASVVDPLGLTISRGIAFLLLFIACLFVVRLVARVAQAVNRVPVIGAINRMGGAAVGVVKAFLLLFAITAVISLLLPLFSLQKNVPMTNTTFDRTYVYSYIYQINPLKDILLKS